MNTLHDCRNSLQAHTRIDIWVSKAVIISVFILIKLCKNKIPKFNVAVAVAANLAVGLAAAVLGTSVEINFRAGTARTLSDFPEVIFLSETNHSVGRNSDFLRPDVICFVIVLINADPKLVFREL